MDPFPIKLPNPFSTEKTLEFEYNEEALSSYMKNESNSKGDMKAFSHNIEFSEQYKD